MERAEFLESRALLDGAAAGAEAPLIAMADLSRCFSIEDLRGLARRRLPGPVTDYLDGGADDEVSMRRNRASFERHGLVPRFLVDVERVDVSTTVLGLPVSMPLLLGPAALHKVFHPAGEIAVARAAAAAGTMQFLSGMASTSLEDVAGVGPPARCFQVYATRDRGAMRELLARVRAAGYPALCASVDVPCGGNRERDRRAGVAMPPRLSVTGWLAVAAHPGWALGFLRAGRIGMPNLSSGSGRAVRNADVRFDAGFTWADLDWLLAEWGGALVVKGLLSVADVRSATAAGCAGIVLSNHGGRQLDTAISPMDVLAEAVDVVGGRAELMIDGGVRRGTDVLKALALGARACLIGRPYLYGLAAAGEAGVAHALRIFHDEIARGLMLLGCRSVRELTAGHVRRLGEA
jgi:L-lactate dehydrogenase (cytochrome)